MNTIKNEIRGTSKRWKVAVILIGFLGIMALVGVTQAYTEMGASNIALRSIDGIITWIDVKEGVMILRNDVYQQSRGITDYIITLQKTLVTDSADKQFLVVKDLRVGDHVNVELIDRPRDRSEEIVARKITLMTKSDMDRTSTTTNTAVNYGRDSIVGPRGAVGPAGPEGEQGLTGARGASGVAIMGERGAVGPAGPVGEQGLIGPKGPIGFVMRGPVGPVGPMGPRGQQGVVGERGETGESLAGYAGPRGAAGPQGKRGPVGDVGPRGETLYGPTGPAGYAGSAGQQGTIGTTGSKGLTTDGVAGLAGFAGISGDRGAKGSTGDQGDIGRMGYWELYKEFSFSSDDTSLNNADMKTVKEIANYMKKSPSLQVGIDGIAVRSRDQNLNDVRINAIRDALINAGVSSDRIWSGSIGNKSLRREGRIAVYFTSL